MTPVRLEPAALRSRVKHSTTEPLRSLCNCFESGPMDLILCEFKSSILSSGGHFVQKSRTCWAVLVEVCDILNLGHQLRRCCLKIFLSLTLTAILFEG